MINEDLLARSNRSTGVHVLWRGGSTRRGLLGDQDTPIKANALQRQRGAGLSGNLFAVLSQILVAGVSDSAATNPNVAGRPGELTRNGWGLK